MGKEKQLKSRARALRLKEQRLARQSALISKGDEILEAARMAGMEEGYARGYVRGIVQCQTIVRRETAIKKARTWIQDRLDHAPRDAPTFLKEELEFEQKSREAAS